MNERRGGEGLYGYPLVKSMGSCQQINDALKKLDQRALNVTWRGIALFRDCFHGLAQVSLGGSVRSLWSVYSTQPALIYTKTTTNKIYTLCIIDEWN